MFGMKRVYGMIDVLTGCMTSLHGSMSDLLATVEKSFDVEAKLVEKVWRLEKRVQELEDRLAPEVLDDQTNVIKAGWIEEKADD